MCNRYPSDIRKAGQEKEYFGFDKGCEACINPILEDFPKVVALIINLEESGEPKWNRK
jgi:hypothetical protein